MLRSIPRAVDGPFLHAGMPPPRVVLSFATDRFDVRIVAAGGTHPIVDPDIRAAQRLRHAVFAAEMGAHLGDGVDGIDEDRFDAHCDHLIVVDRTVDRVVGTYRILAPEVAARIGYYADSEFVTTQLASLKPALAEFGRSCIDRDYREGPVIMLLWTGLARYLAARGYEHVIGCASVGMEDGGRRAASLYRSLITRYAADPRHRVQPRRRLHLEALANEAPVEVPALIRGYLRIGACICGEPSWDPDFDTADFFMLLSLSRMDPRSARHFGIDLAPTRYLETRRAA